MITNMGGTALLSCLQAVDVSLWDLLYNAVTCHLGSLRFRAAECHIGFSEPPHSFREAFYCLIILSAAGTLLEII